MLFRSKDNESRTMFAYAATSSFHYVAAKLGIPLEQHNAIVDSGASRYYCPDKLKFKNFLPKIGFIRNKQHHMTCDNM